MDDLYCVLCSSELILTDYTYIHSAYMHIFGIQWWNSDLVLVNWCSENEGWEDVAAAETEDLKAELQAANDPVQRIKNGFKHFLTNKFK